MARCPPHRLQAASALAWLSAVVLSMYRDRLLGEV
jgi:hypothetical protein